ncbi:AAA family ATPase [Sulfurimonas sp. HSL1-6]|uniref:AAA family ATPase n=1 Tax=Thiomicrolovo immobilis TaxID=3131935 RepID=UPI0031F72904
MDTTITDLASKGQERAAALLEQWLGRFGQCPHFGGVADLLVIAGPPASGKKLMMLQTLVHLGRERLHLHMGEFAFADDAERLLGTKGILTRWVTEHPEGAIVFEDIDEADHAIQRAVAAIITDGAPGASERYGRTLFVLLFKIKSPEWVDKQFLDRYYDQPLLEQAHLYEGLATTGMPDESGILRALFDPELLNVMSETDLILLYPHDLQTLRAITEQILQTAAARWNTFRPVPLEVRHPSELALALLLSFSPYLNTTRVAHRLPAYLFDLAAADMPETGRIVLDVSKDARNWLRSTFADESDLKAFGKYDRRFSLNWERHVGKECTELRLRDIEEHSQEITPLSTQSDRLTIHPVGRTGFDAIAGQNRVKQQLASLVALLHNDRGLKTFGITLPKGLLLYGPEGVGKTLLVKAFAKEAGLPYLYLRGSDLFNEELIEAAFQRARQAAPLLVILDNVDVKGIIEGNYTPIPTEALDAAIDGSPDSPENFVFTVMTAQHKEEVPAALMHPGRIDQFVEVPELDREARLFFAKQLLEKPHEKIDIERITRYMSGMNGYELGRIAKACALEAIKQNKATLDEQIIIDQINTIKYGSRLEKKRLKNFEEDLRRSAYHEAAHAVTSMVLLPEVEIEQVTVIPRSETLGLVSYTQEQLQANMSADELRANIAVSLAGRLATIKQYGEGEGIETGAYNDLQQATLYAYSAVAQYGMDSELQNISIEMLQQNVSNTLFDTQLQSRIAVWIAEGTARAKEVIDTHWALIETVAQRLIAVEFIEGSELKSLLKIPPSA